MTDTNLSFRKGGLLSIYTTGEIVSITIESSTVGDLSHFSATVSFAAPAADEDDSWNEGKLTA